MNASTPSPTPIYWDGESMIVTRWNEDGLPDMLIPSDTKIYTAKPSPRDNFRAEDLDRKCTEMEHQNRWYR